MKRFALLVFVIFPCMLFSAASGVIKGKVTDAKTGDPVEGAEVVLLGTSFFSVTDTTTGEYVLNNISPGKYTIQASLKRYQAKVKKIEIKQNEILIIHFKLMHINIEIPFDLAIDEELPVDQKAQRGLGLLIETPKIKSQAFIKTFGSSAISAAPAKYPYSEIPIQHNTEEYSKINETRFLEVIKNPLSTFAADVDAASYANVRRFIMDNQLPMKDAVRTEEMVNYFTYDYPEPKKHPLSIYLEYSECPWNQDHHLVHIGLQGKRLNRKDEKPSNLVFLIDVSGSMKSHNKLPLLKKAFKLLIDQLKPEDKVSIVVYASAEGLALPTTPGSEKQKIKNVLDQLNAGGSTAGGAGIKLAYQIAKENFIKDGNNRIILATDGDFNVGISSTSELVRFVEEKRDEGIFLTVLGFGMGNYKDERLQELADRGNGNHAYIDNILEARKVLVYELTSTLFTIAKDVKIQVEFNPAKVHSYRLIGYENRRLANEDFEDDTKDAGEVGAGHTVTALYEIIPSPKESSSSHDLKYQETQIKEDAIKSGDVLTVRIRYKEPTGSKSKEFSQVLQGGPVLLAKSSDNYKWSAAIAEFALILFDSEYKNSADLKQVLELARTAKGDDQYGFRNEFLNLVERVIVLKE